MQQEQLEQLEVRLPSLVLFRLVRAFQLGLLIFLLLSSMACSAGNAAHARWQPAQKKLPLEVLVELIEEHSVLEGEDAVAVAEGAQAWQLPGQQGSLVIVDFNTNQLCGQGGCLYVGLWKRPNEMNQELFATYFDDRLPPGTPFMQPMPDGEAIASVAPLPCFQVSEMVGATVRQSVYCFNGGSYEHVDERNLSLHPSS